MNEAHRKILKLLKEIDDICKKNDITYYAAGGTTIGAIRHKGFIPWDDDADIYMTRDNFEKFRIAFNKENIKDRVLGCVENDPLYNATIPRYIDTSTTCITRYNAGRYNTSGILIDIFILDPVSSEEKDQKRHINLLSVYSDFIMPYYSYSFRNDDEYKDAYYEYKRMETEVGREKTIELLEQELFSYPEDAAEYYILRWGSGPHVFHKSLFGTPAFFDFHGFAMPVPTLWFEYLVQLYGLNWTHFPKFIQDQGHVSVIDENTSYINYVNDYEEYLDLDKVELDCQDRKEYILNRTWLRRPFEQKLLVALEEYVHISINKKLKKSGKTLNELYRSKDYDGVLEIVEAFTKYQFSIPFIGNIFHGNLYRYRNPHLIDLSPSDYFIIICAYISNNRFKEAKKLLELLILKEKLNDEKLVDLKKAFDTLIDAMGAYYYEKYNDALNLIDSIYVADYFHVSLMDQIKFNTLIKLGTDPQQVLELVDKSLSMFPNDLDLLKIKGDCLFLAGDENEAKELYSIVVQKSTNGIDLSDIEGKTGIAPQIVTEETGNNVPKSAEGEIHLRLLTEIDKLCRENGIEYSLGGRTALYAYQFGCFRSEYVRPTIFMSAENAHKFIEIIDTLKIKNRKIRYSAYGKSNIGANFEYCDVNTSRISFSTRTWGNASVYIQVPEKNSQAAVSQLWLKIKKLVALAEYRSNNNNKNKHFIMKVFSSVAKWFIGADNFDKKICMKCINNTINNKKSDCDPFFSVFNGKKYVKEFFSDKWFDNYKTIELYGLPFRVFDDVEEYIESKYGIYAYENLKVRPAKTNAYKVLDIELPIDTLIKSVIQPVYEGSAWDEYMESKKYTKLIKDSYNSFRHNWNIILRTEARFVLARKYKSIKPQIMAAFKNNDYGKLDELLKEYDVEAVWFQKRGLGLCFDSEIFEVYCEYLVKNGRYEFSESLKNLIPKAHYSAPEGAVCK